MNEALKAFLLALPVNLREEDKVKHLVWGFLLTLKSLLAWSVPVTFAGISLPGRAMRFWGYGCGSGFCLFDLMGSIVGSVVELILAGIFSSVLWLSVTIFLLAPLTGVTHTHGVSQGLSGE